MLCGSMDKRSQGATEYLLMLGAVLVIVAGIIFMVGAATQALGSSVSDQIDNVMDNVIIPGLAGMLL